MKSKQLACQLAWKMENIINTNLVTLDLLKRGGGGTVMSLAAGKAGA